MQTFSVVFCGTPTFALPTLTALINDKHFSVQLVITQPDRKQGRAQRITPSPIAQLANAQNIPTQKPESIRRDVTVTQHIRNVQPDFLIVVAYGQILPQHILDIPTIAPVNIHASLLPRWRGASPIQHTILYGDKEGGVTIQRMEKGLDTGPILSQKSIPIDPRETAVSLHDKLADMGATLLRETLKQPLTPRKQDVLLVTECHKLTREDGVVDTATMNAEEIDRRVRALVPWPGVTCIVHNQSIKLLNTALVETSDSLAITCKDNTILYLLQIQPPGKKPMTGTAWAQGYL
ncbi:methionyl-tRNA formyltransferase [Candidatus Peregrinibacteria bacterium CG10_big_fil_rev_8_21_14_0_10_49_16]|nr:MAG: methionyl-tRNA formyltransferase [Candidatus Peregrinibacteria bacterium CG10_big_fil_rev_8_21_14_0_10_49_16]